LGADELLWVEELLGAEELLAEDWKAELSDPWLVLEGWLEEAPLEEGWLEEALLDEGWLVEAFLVVEASGLPAWAELLWVELG